MAAYTSSGSFEPESIIHEQRMEAWVKRSMKFTRIVKSESPRYTHANGGPKSAGDVPIYASRVYAVSNNEQHVNGLQNP